MKQASFRFYAELNDFLSGERDAEVAYGFRGNPAIKDAIEAMGVPHTEVDLILINGESVGFSRKLQHGDRVSVYPVIESLDIRGLTKVRPKPLRHMRFVLDTHLGRLAAYLRMMGFDSRYQNDCTDEVLARISREEGRVLLTKDRGLLRRSQVTHGYCVRAVQPRRQLREVLKRFDLFSLASPFTRCMRCNGELDKVTKREVADQLPPRTRQEHNRFKRCRNCGGVYWPGSHYRRMQQLIEQIEREVDPEAD
ncbi:MAG: Mut7-C RNAse domain-containing protein [Anaerolineales bacterium]|jgi:hypothetical protein